ncbi:deoxyhypusine synthase family protein [Acidobacteriota bacterium]
MDKPKIRSGSDFRTGFDDKLDPLEPLDILGCKDFDEMLQAMCKTAFGGRKLGEAADVLFEMVTDPQCTVVATISGAMTVAKLSLLVCEMIDRGMVNAIIATGALISHGIVESVGATHFKYKEGMEDPALFKCGYARVYDTLELERNLLDMEETMMKILNTLPRDTVLSSRSINTLIGEYLTNHIEGRGILKSAYQNNVPIYIPAYTDSVLGMYLALFNANVKRNGEDTLAFDPFIDLAEFTDLVQQSRKVGIFTVGGGVPRNWGQQVGPYLELLQQKKHYDSGFKRYSYGVRLCPEPIEWGGLSGCTYSEGVSWGKFVPPEEGGKWAEVPVDATIAWPILLKAVIERIEKKKK